MAIEQPAVDSVGASNMESSVRPEPEHEYGFREGNRIADRYEVIVPLGYGGFSDVYHCRDLRLRRDVAVKVLTRKGVGLEEAQAAASLDHSHIVQVYDVAELDDGTPFIVFQYVKGETLEQCLNQAQYRRLPLEEATLRIVRQISEALDYAHSQGVIHRDVKPSNIILDLQKNACLTDFGLAEVKKSEKETMMSAEVQRRLSGTIPYMAPEQLKEETPGDQRSDLYSLGVVVYETLTGLLPYRGRDAGLIFQIATSEPIPPTLANSELPKGIEPVLLRALEKDPAKRYSSCKAFVDELGKAAQAYVAASEKYSRARQFIDAKRWRDALAAFQDLESQAPGFRDAAYHLEQAHHQVRLLELFEKAQNSLGQGKYQDTLDTLNMLTQLAPDYDVADLRTQAQERLAQEEKRSLDEQYQQAVRQCQNGEYQACLDTLAVIRKRKPDYLDSEGIEANAQEQVERQRLLRDLYTQGVSQMGQEQWAEAIVTFQKLQKEAPGYEDVVARLVTCRHLARLTSYLREAKVLLDQEAFTASVDKLDELQRLEADYKRDEVAGLRQEVLNRLHGRVEHLLREEKFEDSLTSLAELRNLATDYPGLDELEKQAQEGVRIQDLRAELDDLYRQAEEYLGRSSYAEASGLWQEIQQRKGNLDYADARNVEKRAREGLCISLYGQALEALDQGEPQQALKLWHQIHDVDPSYPDRQRIEQRARAMDLYNQALAALDKKKDPHRALELWHQVRQVDPSYRDSQRVEPRAQAMTLYDQALEALTQQAPQKALELWRQVRAKDPYYQDSQRVEPRAQAMNLYNQALAALSKAEYQQALELWHQVREADPQYPDNKRVEQQAQAMGLYSQALGALAQRNPQRALELWRQVRTTDPHYPDSQGVEKQAQAMISRRKTQRLGFFLGGGAGIVVLLLLGTFALMAIIDGCPSPTITPASTTPPPATTAAPPITSTVTQTPTPSPTPTVNTPTPTPTTPPLPPTTTNLATAIQGASIFAAPAANSRELGSVSKGEQVTVLGRSAVGQWYYVRDDQGVEGFVYVGRFEWPGDYESLPVKGSISVTPATRVSPTSQIPLVMDLWDLPGTEDCDGGVWYKSVFIQGHGGNGVYTYYWNGQRLVGPTDQAHTFQVRSTGGAIIGTGKVVSGDGQEVARELFIKEPDCAR